MAVSLTHKIKPLPVKVRIGHALQLCNGAIQMCIRDRKKALDYIENPAKTDEKMLVSSFACSYETADIEFELLLSQACLLYTSLQKVVLIEACKLGQPPNLAQHHFFQKVYPDVVGGLAGATAVSYTHLDVYKRQHWGIFL